MPMRPPIHQPIGPRPGRTPPRRSAQYYHSVKWQRVRLLVLERDLHRCRLLLSVCTTLATTADHIVERADGGSDDPSNLRAVCAECHNARHPGRSAGGRY